MHTFFIHIQGIVQGVGFRPFVYKLAISRHLNGWVNNTIDGVHIQFNTENSQLAQSFLDEIIEKAPKQSKITDSSIIEIKFQEMHHFAIVQSDDLGEPNLLVAPDFAICSDCKTELFETANSRYKYPFITCTNCGPRYAITQKLPYDRDTTTMVEFKMCSSCQSEYKNPLDRRFYSQTNSCPTCRIKLSLYEKGELIKNDFSDFDKIIDYWNEGKIIAIKSIGGFLLTCDATNPKVIQRLRQLKNRPSKPFALMYHDIYELAEDVEMDIFDKLELESSIAPILLLQMQKDGMTPLAYDEIAPHLKQLGVMMPSTGLFEILLKKFKKPIVATSGNPSNSTIVYRNSDALENLSLISDIILLDDRDIVIPQDDSIINFSTLKYQRIVLRRSKGMAPSYINSNLKVSHQTILSMGAMIKSSFTLLHNKNVFISQYLGNTLHFEAETNYKKVLTHFEEMLQPKFDVILTDKHPNYFTSQYGKELGQKYNTPVIEIQHHKAHFYAVLAENNLLETKERILGVIWDGIGLGDDGNIWGGEFFEYTNRQVERIHHLEYFDYFLGDKMSKEPRISALSLMHNIEDAHHLLKEKFSKQEWSIYSKLIKEKHLKTSSIGRLFDAVSSIVMGIEKQSFEGEAAILLENAAYKYFRANGATIFYSYFENDEIPNDFLSFLIKKIVSDINKGFEKDFIAAKFHISMAHYIKIVAKKHNFTQVAFSGGVFQNAWLVDLVIMFMGHDFKLFFHKELSPNDENISFGQMICYLNKNLEN